MSQYISIDSYLINNGFRKIEGEPPLYIEETDGKVLIIFLYVDDFLIADFKEAMRSGLKMTDLVLFKYFLDIEVKQMHNGIIIFQ